MSKKFPPEPEKSNKTKLKNVLYGIVFILAGIAVIVLSTRIDYGRAAIRTAGIGVVLLCLGIIRIIKRGEDKQPGGEGEQTQPSAEEEKPYDTYRTSRRLYRTLRGVIAVVIGVIAIASRGEGDRAILTLGATAILLGLASILWVNTRKRT